MYLYTKKTGIRWKERVTNTNQSKNGTETDEKTDKMTDKQQNESKWGVCWRMEEELC